MRLASVVFSVALAALPAVAAAQAPERVATYRDWIVYTTQVGDDKVCYAVTEPSDMQPTTANHGTVAFMVSTWASGVAENQPSFMAGYDLRDTPEPLVRVGADRWQMFASGVEGFIEDDAQEDRLIDAMRRGSEMRLSAMSERGTATEYTFSLYGISNALDRVERACQ